jgi:hemerythrin-like domain-containing protein
MIIEGLSQEHRNIEKLLAILERELEVFDRGDRPDYEVSRGPLDPLRQRVQPTKAIGHSQK